MTTNRLTVPPSSNSELSWKAILGVDPGLDGGWAIYWPEQGDLLAGDIPTSGEGTKRRVEASILADTIRSHPDICAACLERVGARPGQAAGAMFRFGMAFGTLLGTVSTLGLPYHLVTPQVWKKHFGLVGPDKEQSRQLALELWPMHADLFKFKKRHGWAEAALLARWYADKHLVPLQSEIKVFEGVRQLRAIANGRLA